MGGGSRFQKNPAHLVFNFKTQMKANFRNLNLKGGWGSSVGVVLKILKILEKREKKLEKSKTLFINYLLKYFIKDPSIKYLSCKYFSLNTLGFLRKLNFFKKISIFNLIFLIVTNYNFNKRIRRIKRRLKKRIFKYEGTN